MVNRPGSALCHIGPHSESGSRTRSRRRLTYPDTSFLCALYSRIRGWKVYGRSTLATTGQGRLARARRLALKPSLFRARSYLLKESPDPSRFEQKAFGDLPESNCGKSGNNENQPRRPEENFKVANLLSGDGGDVHGSMWGIVFAVQLEDHSAWPPCKRGRASVGHKVTREATPDERDAAIAAFRSQARRMIRRSLEISARHREGRATA